MNFVKCKESIIYLKYLDKIVYNFSKPTKTSMRGKKKKTHTSSNKQSYKNTCTNKHKYM